MMKTSRKGWTVLLTLVCAHLSGCAMLPQADSRWTPPAVQVTTLELPWLSRPLVLDGDLKEWTGMPSLAIRSPGCIVSRVPAHEWKGPADAGMEVYCAWTAEGLCVAADVSDDDVRNDREGQKIRNQDCVEILVDSCGLSNRPPGAQFYKFYVRPPAINRAVELVGIDPPGANFQGLKAAAVKTAGGYVVEALIPWTVWPDFKVRPGSELGLFFRLDEYDARDGETNQPLKMTYRGVADLSGDGARKMSRWVLANTVKDRARQAFELNSVPRIPWLVMDPKAVPVSLDLDKKLGRVGSLQVRVSDADGRVILEKTLRAEAAAAEWGMAFKGTVDWPADLADGFHVVTLTSIGADGRPVGQTAQPVLVTAASYLGAMARLKDVNLPGLSQMDPFRAASWLSVATDIEKMKRAAETQNIPAAIAAVRETAARRHVLETARLADDDRGMYRLIGMAADPQSQVVVEYGSADLAAVVFYWGAVPLVSARIQQFPDAKTALKTLRDEEAALAPLGESTKIGGFPARLRTHAYTFSPAQLADFAPDRHILLTMDKARRADMLDLAGLSHARARAAAILPDCPEGIRNRVMDWARRTKTPLAPLPEALTNDTALIAGDVRAQLPAAVAKGMRVNTVRIVGRFSGLELAAGERLITIKCPSPLVAKKAAELVLAGNPPTPADVDELRGELVRSLMPAEMRTGQPPALPGGQGLFCGDMHMHTFYSDGNPSPVGLIFESIYCNLDFAILTDHNTVAGAQLGSRLLREHGFAFPVGVGEEVTKEWAHFNAYPLRKFIPPTLTLDDVVAAAHEQGAVIQWNHPGYPPSEWTAAQMPCILEDTGLDAWEHYPAEYDEWKKAGKLPVITGTTDTHDGTFKNPERSIILAPSADGEQVAAAVRSGNIVAISPEGDKLFYGSDRMVGLAWAALADGPMLKEAKAQRIRTTLKNADVVGLIRASPARRIEEEKPSAP